MSSDFFLHIPTGRSWPTDDPHRWLLDHATDDLLAAARERLLLSPDDRERCLRVVLRRCGLALVRVVNHEQVVVQHWSDPAPDLRAWAKKHGFNQPGVHVAVVNVKNSRVVVHGDGLDLLLYGERAGARFPWDEYAARYERRQVEEAGDGAVAPAGHTNFGWAGVPRGRLTWRVLKAVWNSESVPCPNCGRLPLLLTAFGWHEGPRSFRSARVFRHCVLGCRRRFEGHESEPLGWVASVLPPSLRPGHLEQWRRFDINWERLAFRHERPVQVADREA